MAAAKDLVALAASQIGVKESPANSNMQKYGRAYGVNGVAWCCQFVWWLFSELGASALFYGGKKVAYCPYVLAWAKKEGVWLGRTSEPRAGDVVLFGRRGVACHIGVVERRLSATKVQTIEGNTSVTSDDDGGAVMRRTRPYGAEGSSWYVMGFVRPKWPEAASAAKATAAAKASSSKATAAATYKVTASALNVRTRRSTLSGKVVGTLKRGAKVRLASLKVNKSGNTWAKVASGKHEGRYVCVRFHGSTYAKKA